MSKFGKDIEYQMTKKMFNAMLEGRTEEQKKGNPYTYVMDVINNEFGLRGVVKHLFILDD